MERRAKLHKAFGTSVQYSVFEVLLEQRQILEMKKAVRKIIKPRLDKIPICNWCLQGVEITSG
jgi:CRISPR-associated endonuclease Cas2